MEVNRREIDILIESLEAYYKTIEISEGGKRFEYGILLEKLILIQKGMSSSDKLVFDNREG